MAKVSVIIPVYNGEKYIERCLNSLKNQTLDDIEIICVNDGSKDRTEEILQAISKDDDRIKVLNQENSGPVTARNNGIKISNGEYIGFIDIDDFVSQDYYEKLYITAINEEADIAATDNIKLYTDKVIGTKSCGIEADAKILTTLKEKSKIIITTGITWNKIYKKSFLDRYHLEQHGTCPGDDNIFNATTLICANKVAITHEAEYFWVQIQDSVTHKQKGLKDFNVINNYDYIDNWIRSQVFLSDKEKARWLYVLNERKQRDYGVFYRDMADEYKEEFLRIASENLKIKNLIVSLTSFPDRINVVNIVIESILNQSLKAEKVILWLAEEQFPNKEKDLPQNLLDLVPKGLTIDWYHDIKSYKKLIPALKKYPNAVIVTADDDVIYEKNWLKKLYKAYVKNPDLIQAYRCHYILFKNYKIAPYNEWNWNVVNKTPSSNNLFTGVGGVLYPPNCFYKDVLNEGLFTQLAPHADDIWFWAMCVLNNKKIHCIAKEKVKLKYVKDTQQTGLFQINVFENNNDKQIQNVIKYYPHILKYLKKKDVFYSNNFERLFSIKSKNTRKVLTIFGLKFKFKSKKLAEQKRLADIEKQIKKLNKNIKKQKKIVIAQNETIMTLDNDVKFLQEQISQLSNKDNEIQNYLDNQRLNLAKMQSDIRNIDKETLKISQTPNITEVAMLKTKYHWDDIKIPQIKNNDETIAELKNTNKSIIRFGDGEFGLMEGNAAVFQEYEPELAKKMKEIFKDGDDNLMIGIPAPYYDYPINLNKKSKNFILNWFPKWHKIIEKYYNYDRIYYSTHISQVHPVYEDYDFEKHYSNLRAIWDNKKVAIITGDRVFNNIEYNVFDNAYDITYIYGPTENAYCEIDNLKPQIIAVPKDTILIFALGPAGKLLAYDMYHQGYRVLDIGHLIKDYDFYKKSFNMSAQEWGNSRMAFFGKD